MSKKNILSEAVVRKFMKLAELETLSEDFVSEQFKEEVVAETSCKDKKKLEEEDLEEGHGMAYKSDEEDLDEGHGMEGPGMAYKAHEDEEESAEEDAEEDEEEAEELPEEEPELEDEEELEMEEPAEEAEMSISPEEAEVLKSILQKLEAAMGEEAAEAPEMEMDAEPEMEEEPMMEGDKEKKAEKAAEEAEKALKDADVLGKLGLKKEEQDDSLQEMVNNIAARVAKRILEQGK